MEIVGPIILSVLLGWFIYNGQGCANDQVRKQIIQDKGFCVVAESTGQEFKKCYELKEQP